MGIEARLRDVEKVQQEDGNLVIEVVIAMTDSDGLP
jgi:hypothetical protein